METTLGKAHTTSPFTQLYSQYGFSSNNHNDTVVAEESKAPIEQVKETAQKEEKKAEKKQKPAKEATKQPPQKKAAAASAQSDLSEELQAFMACDLRVGKIIECTRHPESQKLYVEKIDLGESEPRTILSGLQEFIPIEQMTEGLCIVFANLKPRPLAGMLSAGMVMCAGNAEHTQVELMRPPEGCKVGERVVLEGNPAGEVP